MNGAVKPKRILFVENGIGYGGAVICLRHLVRCLDRSQFYPIVVTGRATAQYQEIASEAVWKHIKDRHFDITAWRALVKRKPVFASNRYLRFIATQIIARADDLLNFMPFFLQLLWIAWKFEADLIHANNDPVCNRAALLAAKILHKPCVCHVRENPSYSKLAGYLYKIPDHFVSVSNWVADRMTSELMVAREKITVVYDGIELQKLDLKADGNTFRKQFDIHTNDFVVGLVGLLIPWKGQELFLDAAKELSDKIPNLKMVIIGGTPEECSNYEEMLKNRVNNENLKNFVIFTGHIGQMESVYNGLNVVVSASTAPEPLGTVVIESMAMGRPLIGPNHGGGAEMLDNGETGLLFSAGDSESFRNAVLELYQKPDLAERLGENAQEKAIKLFSIKTHTTSIESIYFKLLKQ
ncbi:glycosyltransferase family 4 protein [Methylomonas koyamae]|uniref:glycosyltransferase family 4 protein n=1 Tax=Methylomonas koyamae TaxID=702114 RepID=UPI0011273465|nr:glycosyltransferase family 4 protein [Methylomonas koyamae]TPQ28637.1 glycosyltransferase family 1 protein [Methylomonas koyamae]